MKYYIEVWVDGEKRRELSYICKTKKEVDEYFIYAYFWLSAIEFRSYTFEDIYRPETVKFHSKIIIK